MANPTTALFEIEIPSKDGDGAVVCQKYVLTLTLSMQPVDLEEEGEGCLGEIKIYGAVPPVDDHPPALQEGGEVSLDAGESMQQAA